MQWRDYWTICINLLWLQRPESTSPAVAQSDSPLCHPLSGSYTLLLLLPFSFSFSHSFFYFFFSFYFTINRHPPRAWMFIYAFHLMLIACFASLSSRLAPLRCSPPVCKFTIPDSPLSLMAIPPLHCCSYYLRPLTGRPPVGFITNGNYYWYKWCVTVWVCMCVCHEVRTAETTSKNLSHLQGDNSKEAEARKTCKWQREGRELAA